MTGEKEYNNKYENMALNRISKTNPSWRLTGFYNSLVIRRSYKTSYIYLGYVIKFCDDYVITPEQIDVDDYYSFMVSLKDKSSSEQIGAYHALQKYSKYLKSKNLCEDYMQYIERPKFIETQKTISKRENGFLTQKETHKIINEVKNKYKNECWEARNYAIMMIFLTTGIRCSALYKLDLDDIDLECKTILVHEKGSKTRLINIPDVTVDAIRIWMVYRNDVLGNNSNETALMISNRKKRMEAQSIYVLIKDVGRVVVGKNITPHKLRATYGTQLYNKTHDLYFVQECMGHSNPKTTEIYIRGQKGKASKKASELMSDFLE